MLIADYQRAARAAVSALARQTKASDLLAAWHQGRVKRSGRLGQPRGRYTFHGTGCRFEIAGRIVDVEFGPSGRCDGFDLWRLLAYAQSAFEWADVSEKDIVRSLGKFESDGRIVRSGQEPSPELFYFTAIERQPVTQRAAQASRKRIA